MQKNSYFQGFTCILKVLSFIIVLCIFYQLWRQFLKYFRILFMYNFVHRFLTVFWSKQMPKMDPKSIQNRPQCVPGRPLASWLHPVIFGHAIFTIFDAKMAPKMS